MDQPHIPVSPSKKPVLSLPTAIAAIYSTIRWRMLASMASGEGRMVNELAAEARCSPNAASRHLSELRRLGIVTVKRRLYYLSDKLERPAPMVVDFGFFVARFDVKP